MKSLIEILLPHPNLNQLIGLFFWQLEAKSKVQCNVSLNVSPADVSVADKSYFRFWWLSFNVFPLFTHMDVSACRCVCGTYMLLRVSEEPGVTDVVRPVWPSSLSLVLTPVLLLLQPLLLCLHNHRVSTNRISCSVTINEELFCSML